MTDQRGVTLIELLIAALAAGIILLALGSLYLATERSHARSSSQAALQRQGTLALQEISQRIRSGVAPNALSMVTCNGVANSVQVVTPTGTFCYYAGTGADAGRLCEFMVGGAGGCRNLLAGAFQLRVPHSTPIALMVQPATPDPRCPAGTAAGSFCFKGAVDQTNPTRADFAFAITDGDTPTAMNVMSFNISLACAARNC